MIPLKKTGIKTSVQKPKDNFGGLDKQLLLTMHQFMVKTRVLEERLIKIYRAGESFFGLVAQAKKLGVCPSVYL
jgi:TPP-dependent pyruvate/acetoin dehydrogenase alpha subunit